MRMGIIMAQVAVLQMKYERKVVTSMKESKRLFLPGPARTNTFSASLLRK